MPRLTGRMRILNADGSVREARYGMTTMAQVILDIHDETSPVVGYQLEGRDY